MRKLSDMVLEVVWPYCYRLLVWLFPDWKDYEIDRSQFDKYPPT